MWYSIYYAHTDERTQAHDQSNCFNCVRKTKQELLLFFCRSLSLLFNRWTFLLASIQSALGCEKIFERVRILRLNEHTIQWQHTHVIDGESTHHSAKIFSMISRYFRVEWAKESRVIKREWSDKRIVREYIRRWRTVDGRQHSMQSTQHLEYLAALNCVELLLTTYSTVPDILLHFSSIMKKSSIGYVIVRSATSFVLPWADLHFSYLRWKSIQI